VIFGGALMRRSELALRYRRNGAALYPYFFRNPEAAERIRAVKYVFGIHGGACFTLINMVVFPAM
jgi:hypothetical protein